MEENMYENAKLKNYKCRNSRKPTYTHAASLHMMTSPPSQEKTTDRLPIHWIKGDTLQEREKTRQGQGKDTSFPGSNLQSEGSLLSDKSIVNQETEETPAWALCLYKTGRDATPVSYFVGIYSRCSKVPCLKIMERQYPNQDWDFSFIALLLHIAQRPHVGSGCSFI